MFSLDRLVLGSTEVQDQSVIIMLALFGPAVDLLRMTKEETILDRIPQKKTLFLAGFPAARYNKKTTTSTKHFGAQRAAQSNPPCAVECGQYKIRSTITNNKSCVIVHCLLHYLISKEEL